MEFYAEYMKKINILNSRSTTKDGNEFKTNYLKKLIKDGKVYKFISFNDTQEKNRLKLNTLLQGNIWFSQYKTLNDDTEFQIKYDAKKIAKAVGYDEGYIHYIISCMKEIYDVYSLTYEYSSAMWKNYAADGNGICIEYNVENYDFLFPVEYKTKAEIDYDTMIINAIKTVNLEFAFMPWVVKNPYNEASDLISTDEKEIRILHSPYDEKELNNGKVTPDIKESLGYKGISKPYSEVGLSLSKIIFGNKCNVEIINLLKERYDTKVIMRADF